MNEKEKIRVRIVKQAIKECLKNEIKPILIFKDIFDDKNSSEELIDFFCNFSNKTQKEHFFELISRSDDVEKWADFLKHEQLKKESEWEYEIVKIFAEKIPDWYKKKTTRTDNVLYELVKSWGTSMIKFEVTIDEYKIWRIKVLRKIIKELMGRSSKK
ncbi:hypothetical protein HY745_06115 [Candidatus Desantisbacteria bacterium]|nr:hypothetical protein [Candidatus Desantisbacteria bacterium]